MKFIFLTLLFVVSCSRPDRLKNFIQHKILPPEMQGYALNSYESIKINKTCEGKTIYVIPSESFDMPIDAGVGINLCGSGGCTYYVVTDDGKNLEVIHEANYHGLINFKVEKECPVLFFQGYDGKEVRIEIPSLK